MSRYVNHKHGLCLGSDNIFFVHNGPDVPIRDGYRAIVSFRSYRFEQPDSLNVFIYTPAEQLVWNSVQDKDYRITYVLKNWWKNWLNTNIGPYTDKWDTYNDGCNRSEKCLFFKHRSDALKFIRFVDKRLKGIKISD